MSRIDALFDRVGVQWGLRGDPVLWDALRSHFDDSGLPETTAAFNTALHAQIAALIGYALETAPDRIPVREFYAENGGMSSGMVDRDIWQSRLIPLLMQRLGDLEIIVDR
ncbi:MAG: hypothetical protein ACI86S_000437 [Paracoccaceae bacterium]